MAYNHREFSLANDMFSTKISWTNGIRSKNGPEHPRQTFFGCKRVVTPLRWKMISVYFILLQWVRALFHQLNYIYFALNHRYKFANRKCEVQMLNQLATGRRMPDYVLFTDLCVANGTLNSETQHIGNGIERFVIVSVITYIQITFKQHFQPDRNDPVYTVGQNVVNIEPADHGNINVVIVMKFSPRVVKIT